MSDRQVLVLKPLSHILTFWRPGSHDWSWREEFEALVHDGVTAAVRARIYGEGIGFADNTCPVLLGDDGRVWDGHHRIIIAIQLAIPDLMVEIVGPNRVGMPTQRAHISPDVSR